MLNIEKWCTPTDKLAFSSMFKFGLLLFWILAHIYLTSEVSRLDQRLECKKASSINYEKILQGEESNGGKVKMQARYKRSGDVVVGAHAVGFQKVIGMEGGRFAHSVLRGTYFGWNLSHPLTYISHVRYSTNEEGSTFLEVESNGFYYIYTQLGFLTTGKKEACYQTVSRPSMIDEMVLMESCTSQVRVPRNRSARWLDTSYQGGVFYLFANDQVAVRPKQNDDTNQMFYMDYTKSFFGLYFLSR